MTFFLTRLASWAGCYVCYMKKCGWLQFCIASSAGERSNRRPTGGASSPGGAGSTPYLDSYFEGPCPLLEIVWGHPACVGGVPLHRTEGHPLGHIWWLIRWRTCLLTVPTFVMWKGAKVLQCFIGPHVFCICPFPCSFDVCWDAELCLKCLRLSTQRMHILIQRKLLQTMTMQRICIHCLQSAASTCFLNQPEEIFRQKFTRCCSFFFFLRMEGGWNFSRDGFWGYSYSTGWLLGDGHRVLGGYGLQKLLILSGAC